MYCRVGRLTKNPSVSYQGQGDKKIPVCNFTIACDNGKEKQPDFIPCVCFHGTAENLSKYMEKGGQVFVQGELHNSNWTKDDGTKVYGFIVTCNNVQFLGNPKAKNEAANQPAIENQEPAEAVF